MVSERAGTRAVGSGAMTSVFVLRETDFPSIVTPDPPGFRVLLAMARVRSGSFDVRLFVKFLGLSAY